MAELMLTKTMWGVPEMEDPAKRAAMLERVKAAGFTAVEMFVLTWRGEGAVQAVEDAGLKWIAQVHTTAFPDKGFAGYVYMQKWNVVAHVASLRDFATEAKRLGAVAANCHSGVDGWSIDEARDYLKQALEVEKEVGIPIYHETHRRRLFWNPFQTRDILKGQDALKGIKLNSDISHWVVCLERCFGTKTSFDQNGEEADLWWPEVRDLMKTHCKMIHARVGYEEGPQVPDPSAPEYADQLASHLAYWEPIIKAQIAANGLSIVEPEHGPWPYQQSMPRTECAPTHDIWEANDFIKEIIKTKYPQWAAEVKGATQ